MLLLASKSHTLYVEPCRRCIGCWITLGKAHPLIAQKRWFQSYFRTSPLPNLPIRPKVARSYSSGGPIYFRTIWHQRTESLYGSCARLCNLICTKPTKNTRCIGHLSLCSHTTVAAGKHPRDPQQSNKDCNSLLDNADDKDERERGWVLPKGHDTGIKLFNTLTRKKEPFILPKGKMATWYTCGPTVYDHAHIGHASSYVRTDIIRRILLNYFNIDVVMVMGVTDIDDKIIKRTIETGVSHRHLTRAFETEFFKDMDALNVMPPTVKTRVTEHIPQVIFFINQLIDNGFAYKTPSGTVYFDVQRYGRYGRLWTHSLDTQIRDAIDKDKKGPRDFALWKAAKPNEPFWESPWGHGRPGWHIECSTMASAIFGEWLDIHSGGDDLRFPHHENEMAQSEACFGCSQWTNYWLHTGHLHLKSENVKMSKSLNNTIRITELLRHNTASQFRLFCMLRPYRQQIEYSAESMLKAVRILDTFGSFLSLAEAYIHGQVHAHAINEPELMEALEEAKAKVDRAFCDDIDMPKAVQAMEELIRKANKELGRKGGPEEPFVSRSPGTVASVLAYVERILDVWGIQPPTKMASGTTDADFRLSSVMDSVIQFRRRVREYSLNTQESLAKEDEAMGESPLTDKEKRKRAMHKVAPLLQACDELRDDLKLAGVTIQDHGKSARWILESKKLPAKKVKPD